MSGWFEEVMLSEFEEGLLHEVPDITTCIHGVVSCLVGAVGVLLCGCAFKV